MLKGFKNSTSGDCRQLRKSAKYKGLIGNVVVVVVVAAAAVVVEWLYYSKRIIIVRWADLSDFFR